MHIKLYTGYQGLYHQGLYSKHPSQPLVSQNKQMQ